MGNHQGLKLWEATMAWKQTPLHMTCPSWEAMHGPAAAYFLSKKELSDLLVLVRNILTRTKKKMMAVEMYTVKKSVTLWRWTLGHMGYTLDHLEKQEMIWLKGPWEAMMALKMGSYRSFMHMSLDSKYKWVATWVHANQNHYMRSLVWLIGRTKLQLLHHTVGYTNLASCWQLPHCHAIPYGAPAGRSSLPMVCCSGCIAGIVAACSSPNKASLCIHQWHIGWTTN